MDTTVQLWNIGIMLHFSTKQYVSNLPKIRLVKCHFLITKVALYDAENGMLNTACYQSFIVQGFCRFYLHGFPCRNTNADSYHQTNEQEADEGTKQQAVDFEGSTVP